MTKEQLIKNVAAELGTSVSETRLFVEETINELGRSFAKKEGVEIRGFGTFRIVKRKPKTARDITRNTMMLLPERLVVKFKLSNEIAKKIK